MATVRAPWPQGVSTGSTGQAGEAVSRAPRSCVTAARPARGDMWSLRQTRSPQRSQGCYATASVLSCPWAGLATGVCVPHPR